MIRVRFGARSPCQPAQPGLRFHCGTFPAVCFLLLSTWPRPKRGLFLPPCLSGFPRGKVALRASPAAVFSSSVGTQPRSGGAFLCADRGTIPRAPNLSCCGNPSAKHTPCFGPAPVHLCGAFSLRRRQHSHATGADYVFVGQGIGYEPKAINDLLGHEVVPDIPADLLVKRFGHDCVWFKVHALRYVPRSGASLAAAFPRRHSDAPRGRFCALRFGGMGDREAHPESAL